MLIGAYLIVNFLTFNTCCYDSDGFELANKDPKDLKGNACIITLCCFPVENLIDTIWRANENQIPLE